MLDHTSVSRRCKNCELWEKQLLMVFIDQFEIVWMCLYAYLYIQLLTRDLSNLPKIQKGIPSLCCPNIKDNLTTKADLSCKILKESF